MTALRQEAYRMMEAMPEEGMAALIDYMNEYHREMEEREARIEEKRKAFEELLSMCKHLPNLDAEKELAQSREERFGNAYTG